MEQCNKNTEILDKIATDLFQHMVDISSLDKNIQKSKLDSDVKLLSAYFHNFVSAMTFSIIFSNTSFLTVDDSEDEKFAILSIGKNVANLYFRIDPETFSIGDETIRTVKGWFWLGAERRVGITSENSDLIMSCVEHAYETTKKIESQYT